MEKSKEKMSTKQEVINILQMAADQNKIFGRNHQNISEITHRKNQSHMRTHGLTPLVNSALSSSQNASHSNLIQFNINKLKGVMKKKNHLSVAEAKSRTELPSGNVSTSRLLGLYSPLRFQEPPEQMEEKLSFIQQKRSNLIKSK